MSTDRRVVHAYGALEPDGPVPTWPAGIAEAQVSTVTAGGTVAVTSLLPSEEFDPSTWESHVDDAAWLSAVAVGHHRVLQAAITVGDVVPFRLPSLYGDVDALRLALQEHEQDVTQAMDQVRGRVEWAVKLYRLEVPTEADPPAHTGGDYLRARSRQMQARADANERLHHRVRETYDRISEVSVAAVRNAPQDALWSGHREPMVLNAAFLVRRTDQDRFREAVDEIAQRSGPEGVLLEASGPWPAYNFASVAGTGSQSA